MPQFQSFRVVPKISIEDKEILSLVYTPGVGSSCLAIKENPDMVSVLTNKINSVAVFSFDYESALKRCLFLKSTLLIDSYPFVVKDNGDKNENSYNENLKLILQNIEQNFCAIDLSLIKESVKGTDFELQIPVLTEPVADLKDFFGAISRNVFMFNTSKLKGDISEKSIQLHELAGGVIETELCEEKRNKPIAVVSDGTAVLGFGNIGAEASIPVLEGKIALYSQLADVDGIVLSLKTQDSKEIIKIVQLLEDSFSGVHLEDISAPSCFEVENTLIETLKIPVFHDDQHGTAIIVLAGILNSLILAKKELSDAKIVINGAGAAGSALARLLLFAGAKNIILSDSKGAVFAGRAENNENLEDLAKYTNLSCKKGSLKESIKGADIFIGVSKGNLVTPEMVCSMGEKPIVFALANPVPEILPDEAIKAGAFIAATGRSDFPNQINNSLAFPGLFKGVLEAKAPRITDEMKLESALIIASLVKEEELSPVKIVPEGLDCRVVNAVCENIKSKF